MSSLFFISFTTPVMWYLFFGLVVATVILALATAQRVRNLMEPATVPAS